MPDDKDQFAGQTVIVTGAAGAIGRATAEAFAGKGARVVAADRDAVELTGDAYIRFAGDLTADGVCDELMDQAYAATGRLDVLVNNAGLMRRGNILATSDEDWAASLDVNVTAVFRLCRAAIGRMHEAGSGGAIVNVASMWGLYPGPNHLAYCTSKAAVAAMTQCLARDHAGDGIRVNAVCPNEVNTAMLRTGFEIRGLDADTAIEELNKTVPLGRIAEPEDIADIIVFLASDAARYMAGALIEASGAKPVY